MGVGDFLYYKNENRKFEVRNFVNVVVEDNSLYLRIWPVSPNPRIVVSTISVSPYPCIFVSSYPRLSYPRIPYPRIIG